MLAPVLMIWTLSVANVCTELESTTGNEEGTTDPLITNVSPDRYSLTRLNESVRYYIDRDFEVIDLPAELDDWWLIRTANDDKASASDRFVSFELSRPALVGIAYDRRADRLPDWLANWQDSGFTIATSDPGASPLSVYFKLFSEGRVELGGNMSGGAAGARSMYSVMVTEEAPQTTTTRIPAFPGATGYGASSLGGRGGKVYIVDRLDDSEANPQPGMLRYALQRKEPRTVVFRVAGEIALAADLRIGKDNSYLTIAGQTAPGSGITLRGGFISVEGAHDVIIRYLRLRKNGNRNLVIVGGRDIIIDHISAQYAEDDNISTHLDTNLRAFKTIRNVTLSRSIVGPGLDKAVAGGFRGNHKVWGVNDHLGVFDVDFHHNLLVHNSHRQLKMVNGGSKGINNVVYNFRFKAHESKGLTTVDWINNYIKKGPMSDGGVDRYIVHETIVPTTGEEFPDGSIYVEGNIGYPDFPSPPSEPWTMLYDAHTGERLDRGRLGRFTPLPGAFFPIRVQGAAQAYEDVLGDVGANRRLDCEGNWVDNLDALDRGVIQDVRAGTGPDKPYSSATEAGGYPPVSSGSACADADRDGMPDAYERRYGLDPNAPGDGPGDRDGDGYTNLEEYLSGSPPR